MEIASEQNYYALLLSIVTQKTTGQALSAMGIQQRAEVAVRAKRTFAAKAEDYFPKECYKDIKNKRDEGYTWGDISKIYSIKEPTLKWKLKKYEELENIKKETLFTKKKKS